MSYEYCISCIKPVQREHQRYRTRAKEKKGCTEAEWSKVFFSDERKVGIAFGNQGLIWRESGEAQNPCCLKSSVRFPQIVMVLVAITSTGVGSLFSFLF